MHNADELRVCALIPSAFDRPDPHWLAPAAADQDPAYLRCLYSQVTPPVTAGREQASENHVEPRRARSRPRSIVSPTGVSDRHDDNGRRRRRDDGQGGVPR